MATSSINARTNSSYFAAASTSSEQPILIAVSGLGQDEDKRRAIEAGFDVHFTKPVDIRALTAELVAAAGKLTK